MKREKLENIAVYQSSSGAVEVRFDAERETILLTQQQVLNFLVYRRQLFPSMLKIFLTPKNWIKRQLFPFWKQFKLRVKEKYGEK